MTHPATRIPILVVCTGNICRSPMAAELLGQELRGLPFELGSAGVSAQADATMPDEAQAVARALGAEAPERHTARQLTPRLASDARLILTATRAHRRAVVEGAPAVLRRTFTLREFARLATLSATEPAADHDRAADARDRFDALVGALAARRSQVAATDDDDILDPYRRSSEAYLASGEQIARALPPIAALLRNRFDKEY